MQRDGIPTDVCKVTVVGASVRVKTEVVPSAGHARDMVWAWEPRRVQANTSRDAVVARCFRIVSGGSCGLRVCRGLSRVQMMGHSNTNNGVVCKCTASFPPHSRTDNSWLVLLSRWIDNHSVRQIYTSSCVVSSDDAIHPESFWVRGTAFRNTAIEYLGHPPSDAVSFSPIA